jgi:hypothetical protein
MNRVLKDVQFEASAPKLDERQVRLRVKRSLNFLQRRKELRARVEFSGSREYVAEMDRRFSGVLVQPKGTGRHRVRYRSKRG